MNILRSLMVEFLTLCDYMVTKSKEMIYVLYMSIPLKRREVFIRKHIHSSRRVHFREELDYHRPITGEIPTSHRTISPAGVVIIIKQTVIVLPELCQSITTHFRRLAFN